MAEIKRIEYFEFTGFANEETNMYFESLDSGDSLAAIPKNFILRLTTQVQTLVKEVSKLVSLATSGKISSLWTATADSKFDIEYGLNKIILAVTERNTVFGIESNTGNNKWEKVIPSEWRIEGVYKKKRHHGIKDAVIHLVHRTEPRSQLMR